MMIMAEYLCKYTQALLLSISFFFNYLFMFFENEKVEGMMIMTYEKRETIKKIIF